jgi:hypothetical protein
MIKDVVKIQAKPKKAPNGRRASEPIPSSCKGSVRDPIVALRAMLAAIAMDITSSGDVKALRRLSMNANQPSQSTTPKARYPKPALSNQSGQVPRSFQKLGSTTG